jgi:quinoprotein glucose dehydrogenase
MTKIYRKNMITKKLFKRNILFAFKIAFIGFLFIIAYLNFKSNALESIALQQFLPVQWYWEYKNPALREQLPLYKEISAINIDEATSATHVQSVDYFLNWRRSNANSESIRFSTSKQINTLNVHNLKVAFIYKTGTKPGNIQSNPIIVNEKAIFPTTDDYLIAINASTGKLIWKIKTDTRPAPRGLTFWAGIGGLAPPRVLFAAGDHLYAVSPDDGSPILDFGDHGRAGNGRSMTAPVISNNVIAYPVISNDKRAPSVQGIDLISGKLLWEVSLRKNVGSEYLRYGVEYNLKGGNPWSGLSADTNRGIIYITTGDAQPTSVGINRPGKNDYANSIVAINIITGKIIWSFQEISHDLWDKDIPAPPVITSIYKEGKKIDVVVAFSKHGNTIILDRMSGRPIFPWRLKRAPISNVPGEHTAEYQPDVQIPEPFSKQEFSINDITNIGIKNHDSVLSVVRKGNTGFFPPPEEGKEAIFFNISGGAEWPGASVDPFKGVAYLASNETAFRMSLINTTSFNNEAFEKITGRDSYISRCSGCHGVNHEGGDQVPLLYGITNRASLSTIQDTIKNGRKNMPSFSHIHEDELFRILNYLKQVDLINKNIISNKNSADKYRYIFAGWRSLLDYEGFPGNKPPWGWLNAINLNTGKIIWRTPLGDDDRLLKRGFKNIGTQNIGAPVATSGGLVFCSGTSDKKIRAFDSLTGKELWSYLLPAYGSAAPTIYEIKGKQFILIPATGGNGVVKGEPADTFVAFSL